MKTNGTVLYLGPSQLDPTVEIVVIATGTDRKSANPKTGDMLQTWILRTDRKPHTAAHGGHDAAICGDCPLRKLVSVSGIVTQRRRCYVDTSNAPNQIWSKWKRGGYSSLPLKDVARGRQVRIGAYGDPLAVPYHVWRDVLTHAIGWTGYTHSWRIPRFWRFRNIVMASCESYADHLEAKAKGWRTFQTGSEVGPDQVMCPNTTHGVTCEQCGLCRGSSIGAKSIVIQPHGGKAILSAWSQAS